MAKRKIIRQETYKKGVPAKEDVILKFINNPNTNIDILKTGLYEDGKEFITITIDNL